MANTQEIAAAQKRVQDLQRAYRMKQVSDERFKSEMSKLKNYIENQRLKVR